MVKSLNKVMLIGYVGRDPELHIKDNMKIVSFSLATNEHNDNTYWHNIVAFNKLADIIDAYVKKGSHIYIEGRLIYNKWVDKEGHERTKIQINASNIQILSSRDLPKEVIDPEIEESVKSDVQESIDDMDIPF